MKKKRNFSALNIPAIRKFRESLEKGDLGGFLIDAGERTGAGSVRIKYTLKKRPWIVTVEAKRKLHEKE